MAGIAWLLSVLMLLAACSASPNQPFSQSSLDAGGSGRIPPTISIIAMNGVPPDRAGVLADALAEEAGKRDVAIVQGNFSDGYQLAGTFQAVFEGGGVRILYTWVLTGNTGGELHRMNGQELVAAPNSDPWAGVSDIIVRRMASVTAENLATKLAQLGFKVRQAGVLPPTHTFARAGPGAEKEFDLETYYGAGSPLATASITPDQLYSMSPEELDSRLSAVALKQAQERLRAAGVSSVDELMGETAGTVRSSSRTVPEAIDRRPVREQGRISRSVAAVPQVSREPVAAEPGSGKSSREQIKFADRSGKASRESIRPSPRTAKTSRQSNKASRLTAKADPLPDYRKLATAQPAPDAKTDLADAGAARQSETRDGIDKVALIGVTGSPGRGNDELYQAMRKVLRDAGWPVVRKPGKTALSISGRVALTEPRSGVQQVKLAWAVTLPTGKVLGTVRQANDVPAGSLNQGWGRTAGYAVEAAAEGIFSLVEQVRTK